MSKRKGIGESPDCVSPTAKRPKLEKGKAKNGGKSSKSPPGLAADNVAGQLLDIEGAMCSQLWGVQFGAPITHIYNPLDYASETHSHYVGCYGNCVKRVLFVGMNPGPFGMAQNGVAFGDTGMVKDWLGVKGEVGKPAVEHPSRPIQGLGCTKSEVSGTRFWTLFKELCGTPEAFFKNSYVHNYCPFCFMDKSGKNITPPSLKGASKSQLQDICDKALLDAIQLLEVEWVVGVGKYAADRAKAALKNNCVAVCGAGKKSPPCCGRRVGGGVQAFTVHREGTGRGRTVKEIQVCSIMHPSPINPAANKGWVEVVTSQLRELGLLAIITAT